MREHARPVQGCVVAHASHRARVRRRYLLHLDGQGLSSRMEQLLPLGAVVFKEESGYYGEGADAGGTPPNSARPITCPPPPPKD